MEELPFYYEGEEEEEPFKFEELPPELQLSILETYPKTLSTTRRLSSYYQELTRRSHGKYECLRQPIPLDVVRDYMEREETLEMGLTTRLDQLSKAPYNRKYKWISSNSNLECYIIESEPESYLDNISYIRIYYQENGKLVNYTRKYQTGRSLRWDILEDYLEPDLLSQYRILTSILRREKCQNLIPHYPREYVLNKLDETYRVLSHSPQPILHTYLSAYLFTQAVPLNIDYTDLKFSPSSLATSNLTLYHRIRTHLLNLS